jgi:hypothetical protein
LSLTEAEHLIEAYRLEFNNERPHRSLDHLAPAEFAARQATTATVKRTAQCESRWTKNGGKTTPGED